MTRVNVIPPEVMLDEHVSAHLREGLRPINKLREGKYRSKPIAGPFILKKGHELWAANHCGFCKSQWELYKQEWTNRGGKGFEFTTDLSGVPKEYCNDYSPSKKDYRTNLARICERFRKRKKPYHFDGEKVDTYQEFKVWLSNVKDYLEL